MKRLLPILLLATAVAHGQSNDREAQVLRKIKELYVGLDTALAKHDPESALKFYHKAAKVYPIKGKPLNIVDAVLLMTETYSHATKFTYKTSTKKISLNGNSARVRTVVNMEAVLPDRGNKKKSETLRFRSETDDYWTYAKGWKMTKVRSIEDRTWRNGKEIFE